MRKQIRVFFLEDVLQTRIVVGKLLPELRYCVFHAEYDTESATWRQGIGAKENPNEVRIFASLNSFV